MFTLIPLICLFHQNRLDAKWCLPFHLLYSTFKFSFIPRMFNDVCVVTVASYSCNILYFVSPTESGAVTLWSTVNLFYYPIYILHPNNSFLPSFFWSSDNVFMHSPIYISLDTVLVHPESRISLRNVSPMKQYCLSSGQHTKT